MSVLIKGMKMPKGCITCVFESEGLYDWTMWCQWFDDPLGEYGKRDGKWRHPNCPLVEVPTPHGRLIDEKTIPYIDLNADMPQSKVRVWATFKDKIDRVPAIIEAEGE